MLILLYKAIGAGTGTQTLGLFLGKEALYQLSYTRISLNELGKLYRLKMLRSSFTIEKTAIF